MLPQTLQLYNGVSPCYVRQKTGIPQKMLDAALETCQNFPKIFQGVILTIAS